MLKVAQTRVKYENCKVESGFWEFVKNYNAPYNIRGSSCYFNVAIRFFTSFPHLSDALSRWSKLEGNKDIKTLFEKKNFSDENDLWCSFFKTLQLINESKKGEDVSKIFKTLYYCFTKFSRIGNGQQSASEAISILKNNFEEHCCEAGQSLGTCVTKNRSFVYNNGNFEENCNSERVVNDFFSDPFSGDEYRPDCGLERVFVNEGSYDSYSFTFFEKKYGDIMASERMFYPTVSNEQLIEGTLKFKNDEDEIVNVKTNSVDLKNVATTKLNNNKYGLAIFGNHSGGLNSGHYNLVAFKKPGKLEDFNKYEDGNIYGGLSYKKCKNFSHINPVMYVKQDIKSGDELACFFGNKEESLKSLFEEKDVKDVVTDDIKKEFVELAKKIETEKIKAYRNIIKKILGCGDVSVDLKNELENQIPKVLYDDSIEIDVRLDADEEMTEENNIFSLSDRHKINILSGVGGYGEAGTIFSKLSEIYIEKKNEYMSTKDAKYIKGLLADINKVSLEPGERNFKIATEELREYANKIIQKLREFGLNITDISSKKSDVEIPLHTSSLSPIQATEDDKTDPLSRIPALDNNKNNTPLHTPAQSNGDDTKTKNKTTLDRRSNSGIIIKKKSTDDGKKEKDNERNTSGNEGDKNKKTNNNSSLMIIDDENKTSKPPEITIIDILLCLLIIGIFIIIYKLIEQNKYNKIKNGGGSGGSINYNLKDTHEERKKIDYF